MKENRADIGSEGDRKRHLKIAGIGVIFVTMLAIASMGAFSRPLGTGQDLPKASEILERYVKGLGGAEAIQKYKSRTRKGVLKAASGNTATIVEYVGSYKTFTKVTTANGDFIQAANGKVAWTSNPKGAMLIQPFIPEFWKREGDLSYALHVVDYFRSFETVGIDDFEGRPCFHIKGITNWGDQNEQFYDRQTGLLAGYRFPLGNSKDAPLSILVFQDYKKFGGLLVPTMEISKESGMISTTTYTSVTFDDVDDSVFDPPPALK